MRFYLLVYLLICNAFKTTPVALAADAVETTRYVELYLGIFSRESAKAKLSAHDKLSLADVAVKLERRTGQTDYLAKATELFDAALPEVANKPSDFHTLRMVALVAGPLSKQGRLKPESLTLLRTIALRSWKEFLAKPEGTEQADVDHNIRLAEAFGCAAMANFFPDDQSAESVAIRPRLAHYWEKIKTTGDLDEDASNYTALGIVHCIELAQALGHETDLQSPGFRRMFARQRDLISPTGILPEFGDGFFHLERDAFDFLFLCEYAAKTFTDPTYLTVARRLYNPVSFGKSGTDEWCRASALINLTLLEANPSPLPEASVVSYRTNRSGPQLIADKMILRTGIGMNAAMVMLDLYASGSHAHRAKGPSVAYYEVDGVPLFHNLGRHRTRSAITGNSFWALDGGRPFPGVWKPNEWFTMSIPAEMLNRQPDGSFYLGDRLSLRNFENRGAKKLWFDNLRIEGPQGVRLIDGFESIQGWHRSITSTPGIKVETSSEHTEGQASQALNWSVLKAGAYARMLPSGSTINFKEDAFDSVKLDVKYEGIRPYLHLRDLCQQIDLGDHALPYIVSQARVEQHGQDAWGEIYFGRYIGRDATLQRRLVLTAEGYLVIHDRWTAGKTVSSWNAGQLWQLYAFKESGKDWYCAEDDGEYEVPDDKGSKHNEARRMLVKFATNASTETFFEELDQNYLAPNPKKRPQDKFFTTGSKRTVKAGEIASFTMVVAPHHINQDPKTIADSITFDEKTDRVEVSIGKSCKVKIGEKGNWEVTHSP